MSHTLWRIATDTLDYQADDRTGTGAESTGGRWNRKGTPVVYASESRALACLETVVHLGSGMPLPLNRYLVEVVIPVTLWKARRVFDEVASVGWDTEPAGQVSIEWGTRWLGSKAQLVAEVPSVIVPDERNFLINPLHAEMGSVEIKKVRKWRYDARLG